MTDKEKMEEVMEKENVLEIEFQKVWDKWAWRVIKNNIPFTDQLKEIKSDGIKMKYDYKDILFLYDNFEGHYEMLGDETLLMNNEKLEIEKFIGYVNQKYGTNKRWRAEEGGVYLYIKSTGEVTVADENRSVEDIYRYELGNYFEFEKQAVKVKNSKEWKEFWAKVRAGEIGGDE